MKRIIIAVLAAAALLSSASAQTGAPSGSMKSDSTTTHMQSSGAMQGEGMHHMGAMGASMHTMPATVTSVDQKTGMVEVNSAGMALKLHFPPASLASVKSGDKITLHLGFSKS